MDIDRKLTSSMYKQDKQNNFSQMTKIFTAGRGHSTMTST